MKKIIVILLAVALALFILIQFVPVDRSNPPAEQEIDAPTEVKAVLKESCYDCHSNETEWAWSAYVAPASWVISHDVQEGRESLNFSTWNRLDAEERAEAPHEVWESVAEGSMPMAIYLPFHPSAKLTTEDKAILRAWAGAGAGSGEAEESEEHDEEEED